MTRGQAPLFHRSARQCWKADHIPSRVNLRHFRLIELVHSQPAADVTAQPGRFQVELISITLAGYGIHQGIANFLAALQLRKDTVAGGVESHLCNFLSQTKCDTKPTQMITVRFRDFAVHEVQNDRSLIDKRDIGAQGRHEGRVFETHYARTDNDDLPRNAVQAAEVVGIHDTMVVERNLGTMCWSRTARDQDFLGFEFYASFIALNLDCMIVQKMRAPL